MAPWQFMTKILPVDGLIAHHGKVPAQIQAIEYSDAIPFEELERQLDELPDYWEGYTEIDSLKSAIAKLLPERESWSSLARMFGESKYDEVRIWEKEDDGTLSRINISFSLINPDPCFIQAALDCIRQFNCVFLQSDHLFNPTVDDFILRAQNCSAIRYLQDGKKLSELLGL